jgi:hypothetical protein
LERKKGKKKRKKERRKVCRDFGLVCVSFLRRAVSQPLTIKVSFLCSYRPGFNAQCLIHDLKENKNLKKKKRKKNITESAFFLLFKQVID